MNIFYSTTLLHGKYELNNNLCVSHNHIQCRENEPGLIEMEPLANRNGPQYPTMVRVHERSLRQCGAVIMRAKVGDEIESKMKVKI